MTATLVIALPLLGFVLYAAWLRRDAVRHARAARALLLDRQIGSALAAHFARDLVRLRQEAASDMATARAAVDQLASMRQAMQDQGICTDDSDDLVAVLGGIERRAAERWATAHSLESPDV